MIKNKTAALFIAAVLFFMASGCASMEGKRLKTNDFQNVIGAVAVFGGMAAGSYAGAALAGGNEQSLTFGVIGGLVGGAAAGGLYWVIISLIGEKVDEAEAEKLSAEDKLLMPEE